MARQNRNGLNLKVKNVYASLDIGQIHSETIWLVGYIIGFILSGTLILGSIIATITTNDSEDIPFCIGMVILGSICLLASFFFCFNIESNKKHVSYWIEDAVILEANCVSLGTVPIIRMGLFLKATAIEVTFFYNGDLYIRQSMRKDKLVYLKIFNQYANRKINIAYSPKYDKVMLLKY